MSPATAKKCEKAHKYAEQGLSSKDAAKKARVHVSSYFIWKKEQGLSEGKPKKPKREKLNALTVPLEDSPGMDKVFLIVGDKETVLSMLRDF